MSPEELRQSILRDNPTEEQKDAIFTPETEFLLRASPGSGKTWACSRRFLWRVSSWSSASGGIALLSFTNTAIREFEAASRASTHSACLTDLHYAGTLDSFIERFIIAPFGHLISSRKIRPRLFHGRHDTLKNSRFTVYTTVKKGRKMPIRADKIIPLCDGKTISYKARLSPHHHVDLPYKEASLAVKAFYDAGFYTHDQRNYWAIRVLHENKRLREIIARRFPEIIVDEAQDTGFWQREILNYIREAGSRIILIGDPDQCIYEFNQASFDSLDNLKCRWQIPEKRLSKSFRCNDVIANVASRMNGGHPFTGNAPPRNEHELAYVTADASKDFSGAISRFHSKLKDAGIPLPNSAILCRGHEQRIQLVGSSLFEDLEGKCEQLARIAFVRDQQANFKDAVQSTITLLLNLADDQDFIEAVTSDSETNKMSEIKESVWEYVRCDNSLPPLTLSANQWIMAARAGVASLLQKLGVTKHDDLARCLTLRGLSEEKKSQPLFVPTTQLIDMTRETIHGVKGESIDAVLVVGAKRFFDDVAASVQSSSQSEQRRLCYVAITRARHLLMIAVPPQHLENSVNCWTERGFTVLD